MISAGVHQAKVNKRKREENRSCTCWGVNFSCLVDTVSLYLIGFIVYNFLRQNAGMFNISCLIYVFYNLYRFFAWWRYPKNLSEDGMQHMTQQTFMRFQENFVNENAKLKGEEIDIESSGLSKREWNELMEAFNLRDKLI